MDKFEPVFQPEPEAESCAAVGDPHGYRRDQPAATRVDPHLVRNKDLGLRQRPPPPRRPETAALFPYLQKPLRLRGLAAR